SIVDGELSNRRQALQLLGSFAVLAILLAAFGIYGVLSYVVSLRTRELALRVALGATRSEIMRTVLRHSLRVTVVGTVSGVALSFAATRLLTSLLAGVSPVDPITFSAVSLGLAAVALLAACPPVLRASRADPIVALRSD